MEELAQINYMGNLAQILSMGKAVMTTSVALPKINYMGEW